MGKNNCNFCVRFFMMNRGRVLNLVICFLLDKIVWEYVDEDGIRDILLKC